MYWNSAGVGRMTINAAINIAHALIKAWDGGAINPNSQMKS